MERELIKHIYDDSAAFGGKTVTLGGWVRNLRDSKAFGFIDLNDGSCFSSLQVVFEREKLANYDEIASQNVGAALVVTGVLTLTPGAKLRSSSRRPRSRSRARPLRITRSSRSATARNSSASRLICARGRIFSPRCSACAPRWRSRFTASSTREGSCMSIRRLSPALTVRARVRCSA